MQTTSAQYIVYVRLRPSPWMGPLLRMQTELHFEDCKKMSRSNTCRKSHFVQKIHPAPKHISITLRIEQIYQIGVWSERYNSPEGATRTQTGVLAPGIWIPPKGSPVRATRVFRAFSTRFVGAWYNGGLHPRLWSDQPFRLRLGQTKFDTIWVYFLPLK